MRPAMWSARSASRAIPPTTTRSARSPALRPRVSRRTRASIRREPQSRSGRTRSTMLNAAIIGLGWWGKELVRSVRQSTLIRFSRGVTLEPEAAKEFAADTKLALGTSYEDVLADPAIDAVVLATPHTQHRAQVEAAAERGKHVFCEKPFALSRADAV